MALNEAWHVRTRSRECSATGEKFKEGQKIVTALFPDPESSGYLRRDFSDKAWTEREKEATGEDDYFSHWRTVFTPPPANETVQPVTKQNAEDLLRTLVEEDREHTENTRYILAVMLERQKLLRETDSQPTTGGILRIYEHRKTGEVYIVKDPNIPLDQVEEIQNEVFDLLAPKPAEPQPEASAETPEGEASSEAEPEAGQENEEPAG